MPKQWGKYITNPKNKKNLCDFITNSMCSLGKGITENTELVIGGGLQDGTRCVAITRDAHQDMEELESGHEEADTRMFLHAKHSADPGTTVSSFNRPLLTYLFLASPISRVSPLKNCGFVLALKIDSVLWQCTISFRS